MSLLAVKEPVPITVGNFAEVGHRRSQRAQLVLLLGHGREQLLILLLEGPHITLLSIGKPSERLGAASCRLAGWAATTVRLPRDQLAPAAAGGSVGRAAPFFGDPLD